MTGFFAQYTTTIQKYRSISLYLFIICLYVLAALCYDLFPVTPYNEATADILQPPSKFHLLGTDDLGMDIFSQLLYGTKISLLVGVSCGIFAAAGGSIIGIFAGYKGKKADSAVLSLIEILNSIPELPFMIVLAAVMGADIKNVIFAICLISWVMPARTVRSKAVKIKQQKYVAFAEKYGAGFFYIFRKHLLPEIYPVIAVGFIKIVNRAVIAEASLAFLGLSDPTAKSWGIVLNRALEFENIFLTDYWKWWLVSPVVCLLIFVLSIAGIAREIEKKSV